MLHLHTETEPSDASSIFDALNENNRIRRGDVPTQTHTILLRDDAGATHGGIRGWTISGILHVQLLGIRQDARGQNWGAKLMNALEAWARDEGCTMAHVETMEWEARGFYEKRGYAVFGELCAKPGQTKYFLSKTL